jgi:hypothetical protein
LCGDVSRIEEVTPKFFSGDRIAAYKQQAVATRQLGEIRGALCGNQSDSK